MNESKNKFSYNSVVTSYNLEILKSGGDLQITNTGGLELTSDGDVKIGSDKFNAMSRLVREWCRNALTLAESFDYCSYLVIQWRSWL